MKKNKNKRKHEHKNKNKEIGMQEALKAMSLLTPQQTLSEKLMVDRAMDEMKELAEPMVEYLIAARANADLVRLYMEHYIAQIDNLLAVVDADESHEQGEEDDEGDDEYDEEMMEDDYPDCDGDCDHCHIYVRAVQGGGRSGQAE